MSPTRPSSTDRVRAHDDLLRRGVAGESVMLQLDDEQYYGLDDVGTRFFDVLLDSDSIEAAEGRLRAEFDVDPGRLHADLYALLDELIERKLVVLEPR